MRKVEPRSIERLLAACAVKLDAALDVILVTLAAFSEDLFVISLFVFVEPN